jgi:ketosteroid isomerase-like protein
MSASRNRETIVSLYSAFAALDTDRMAACYAPEATFEDPAFELTGREQIIGMWSMLCDAVRANGRDVWRLELVDASADDTVGIARWDAHYRFSATGRLVHNQITARLQFRDGLIVRHVDSFDFYRWSRQALGLPGVVLGWTPFLRGKVRANAAKNLASYLARLAGR